MNMEKKLKTIIWVLVAIIVVLGGVFIYVWTDRNAMINDLTIDKENLTEQMEQLQTDYANLSSTNDTLNQSLNLEREKVAQLIEKVKQTEATNKAKLRKYEKELGTLRSIMRNYIHQIDSLNTLNIALREEASQAKQEAKESKQRYNDLKTTTDDLTKQVEKGSVLRGRGLSMIGMNDKGKATERSSRATRLKTCITLVENSIAKKGARTVYVRIKGPDGILMTSGEQQIFEADGEQLMCSASRDVDYEGQEVEVCIFFQPASQLTKGVYSVDVYTTDGKVASGDTYLK